MSVNLLDFYNAWFLTVGDAATAAAAVHALLHTGPDLITGSSGPDVLQGVEGNDTILGGDGDDFIDGHKGADSIDGGAGSDLMSFSWGYNDAAIKAGITVDLNATTVVDPWGFTDTFKNIESVRSTRFADTLIGNAASNRFEGLGGNDTINGGAGFDGVRYHRDARYGGVAGVDVNLKTGIAKDGFGNTDTLISIESVLGTESADTLRGGDVSLVTDSYTLNGLGGNDLIIAGTWDIYTEPGAGNDTVIGGSGFDQISYTEYTGTNNVIVNLLAGVVNDPYGGIDTVTSVEGARLTKNADFFIGNAVDNFIRGMAGNDYIDGGAGSDNARYDRDADFGGLGAVTVNLKTGTAIDGFGGTDTLVSIEGAWLSKNADTFLGNDANNFVAGLAGNDTLNGGAGLDRVLYDRDAQFGGNAGVTIDLKAGTAIDGFGNTDTLIGIERARGTNFGDKWMGGDAPLPGPADVYEFQGLDGADQIVAGAYAIYVEPGAGNDTITGGAGSDQISYAEYTGANGVTFNLATGIINDPYGGTDTITGGIEGARLTKNADKFSGNAEDNFIRGLGGSDTINGGLGNDQVRYDRDAENGGTAGVLVDLTAGKATDGFGATDTLISIENVRGTNGIFPGDPSMSDKIYGSGGNNIFQGLGGADLLDGKAGTDTADYSADAVFSGNAGVTVNLATGIATDGYGAIDTLVAIENVIGTGGANPTFIGYSDHITGSIASNVLDGRGGNDIILAGAGNDTLYGGNGADYLVGDTGNDLIVGDEGNDIISSGTGTDQIQIDQAALVAMQADLITDFKAGFDTILMPLAIQAQVTFVAGLITVDLGGGNTYTLAAPGGSQTQLVTATKFV
jgi:Ca2+-binding RTX toxin-like protein